MEAIIEGLLFVKGNEGLSIKELVELTSPKTIIEYFNTEYKNQKQEIKN